ncbi:hypothetical protein [Armatimonas sp.]|uniref:hypothetical protein n=1 Tax=Armatimonas sp. TaxID=1872638 RepID=UPI0037510978
MVFHGVFAYHFQQDTLVNIIFGIEEVATANILTDHKVLFDAGRPYGWPQIEGKLQANLEAYLSENEVRGFEIASSYGLEGWVLAQSMEFIAVTPFS